MSLKKIKNTVLQLLVFIVTTKAAFAQDVSVVGSIQHTLKHKIAKASSRSASGDTEDEKVIQLLRVQLSDKEKNRLVVGANELLAHPRSMSAAVSHSEELPDKADLGMNNVPVLDQGIHGTCVTFAVTGVLDALIDKGDYISQLCNLQLGSYLEKHGYGYSGWDGSFATNVINQIEEFGVINKEKQKKQSCGGLTSYPTYSSRNSNSFMEPEQYHKMSEFVFGKLVSWTDVHSLEAVKQALNSGDRLVFGVMFPRIDLGFVGAVGRHNTWIYKDTWVLTPEILKGVNHIEAGHEMIITGYDDNAVATDDHGKKHTGLLTLRNSWGNTFGDYGEFYMSYDYFELLKFDAQRFSAYLN